MHEGTENTQSMRWVEEMVAAASCAVLRQEAQTNTMEKRREGERAGRGGSI